MSTLEDMQAARERALPLPRGAGRAIGPALPWPVVGVAVALVDLLVLTVLSSALGQAYFSLVLHEQIALHTHAELGATIGVLVVAALMLQGAYRQAALAQMQPRAGPVATALVFGMMTLLAVMFLTKSSEDYSRSVIILSFACALPAMLALRRAERAAIGGLTHRRILHLDQVMLIGGSERIRDAGLSARLADAGYAVAGRAALDLSADDSDFEHATRLVSSAVRMVKPDCIMLCLPWAETGKLSTCISVLSEHPASIHVDGDPYIGMLASERVDPLGFLVVGRPLSQSQLALKRLFDILLSALALVVAMPVMVLAALAIRLETPGPALFTQQRYGYNRDPFRIYKFRTMRADPDSTFRQASRGDARITRVGRILRRTNIDELPQLINVLVGDMSLVGPRPHPIELDHQFSPLISRYTQRHRVRPGITGWAQVNGFRGETDTTDKMQGRIAHDLYYLNNWSFWLDLKIILQTVLSATAYRNAR